MSTLPSDNVTLSLSAKTQTLNVRCGSNVTDIKGIDAQEFPPIPVPDLEQGISIGVTEMKEMIAQVAFAASSDEARPVLQGVSLRVEGSDVVMAATDGFRISVRRAQLSEPVSTPVNAIIPARALSELARIASDGEQNIVMNIPSGRGQVIFHVKNAELVSQLIEGNFPDYKVIIPRSFKTHTVLAKAEFFNSCKQAEIIARESNNVVRLTLTPGTDRPGQVQISAQSEETGTSDVSVDANIEGSNLIIAFNVRYLREVLDVIKTPSVVLETNANNTPALIKPAGDDSYTHVIMPMHLG